MSSNITFFGPFKDVIPDYIAYKEAFGYQFGRNSIYRIKRIDKFFFYHGVRNVSIPQDIYELWAVQQNGEKQINRAYRINLLNDFSHFLIKKGFKNIYIDEKCATNKYKNFIPYIFSSKEIDTMFSILQLWYKIDNSKNLASFIMMFMLYYSSGLRKSEVLNLLIKDFDFKGGTILILDAKSKIKRYIYLSESVNIQLNKFIDLYCIGKSNDSKIFTSKYGKSYSEEMLYTYFHRLLDEAKIPQRSDAKSPRLHDLRHTFSVNVLNTMAKNGTDLYVSLSLLSIYLGHKNTKSTEYYLRLVKDDYNNVTNTIITNIGNLFPEI